MPIEQYTYWSVTINNPDDNDYLIMRNPNDKYIRSLVWTPEEGAEGTEHIQAWIRLQRNQSLAFVKKLYPRAHLKPVDKDAYNENTHQYAQKNDETTNGNHEIILNDPLPAVDSILYQVLDKAWDQLLDHDHGLRRRIEAGDDPIHEAIYDPNLSLKKLDTDWVERVLIRERSGLEKLFCSPAYEKMKVKYWRDILFRLKHKQNARGKDNESTPRGGSHTQEQVIWCEDDSYEDDCSESVSSSERSSDSGSVSGSQSEE